MSLHLRSIEPRPMTAADAVTLFEAIDRAMEAAAGGKYRGYNLAMELRARGLDVSLRPVESESLFESSSDIGHG